MQVFLAVLAVIAAAAVSGAALRALLRWRGTRLVRCPETRAPAAVEVDVKEALLSGLLGHERVRLSDCSRWPARAGCDQDCLAQVERAPEDCRVRTIVAEWYQGKACVYCGHAFGQVHWHDHRPALRTAQGVTRQWNEVRPEELPALFATCLPVCWDCHVAESFRHQHPELVVDRARPEPPRTGRPV
jgi:hypothetical protein